MGQYWVAVNLDRGQHLSSLAGSKLSEQTGSYGSPPGVLFALLTTGVDDADTVGADGQRLVGSWAGERVVFVGDYTEDCDLPDVPDASGLFERCADGELPDVTADLAPLLTTFFGLKPVFTDPGSGRLVTDEDAWLRGAALTGGTIRPLSPTPVSPDTTPLLAVDLDAGEFFDVAVFGVDGGLPGALWAFRGGPAGALAVLTAVSNGRGGGDIHATVETELGELDLSGRWRNHRLAVVSPRTAAGAFEVPSDGPLAGAGVVDAAGVYDACRSGQLSDISELIAPVVLADAEVELLAVDGSLVRTERRAWTQGLSRRSRDGSADRKVPAAEREAAAAVASIPEAQLGTVQVDSPSVARAVCRRAADGATLPAALLDRLVWFATMDASPPHTADTGAVTFAGGRELDELREMLLTSVPLTVRQLAVVSSSWPLTAGQMAAVLHHPQVGDDVRVHLATQAQYTRDVELTRVASSDVFVHAAMTLLRALPAWRARELRVAQVRKLVDWPGAVLTAAALAQGWEAGLDELVDAATSLTPARGE